jgi:hypothetical protein
MAKEKHAGGRPCEYTEEIGEEICFRLANGESLLSICKDDHLPHRGTVIRWVLGHVSADGLEEFRNNYACAREAQYEMIFDECIDIADDTAHDWTTKTSSRGDDYEVPDREVIQRSKIKIETRMSVAERMRPDRFGKLSKVDHSSSDGSMSPTDEARTQARNNILKEFDE